MPAIRGAVLQTSLRHGGCASLCLPDLEPAMSNLLTPYDNGELPSREAAGKKGEVDGEEGESAQTGW